MNVFLWHLRRFVCLKSLFCRAYRLVQLSQNTDNPSLYHRLLVKIFTCTQSQWNHIRQPTVSFMLNSSPWLLLMHTKDAWRNLQKKTKRGFKRIFFNASYFFEFEWKTPFHAALCHLMSFCVAILNRIYFFASFREKEEVTLNYCKKASVTLEVKHRYCYWSSFEYRKISDFGMIKKVGVMAFFAERETCNKWWIAEKRVNSKKLNRKRKIREKKVEKRCVLFLFVILVSFCEAIFFVFCSFRFVFRFADKISIDPWPVFSWSVF